MNANTPDTTGRLELAIEAAREAGRITLKYFRRPDLQVEQKEDRTPVTVADLESEEHLRRRIAEAFPEDAVFGEEFPQRPGTSGWSWFLDPIDGTKAFIHGVPLFGTVVGVEYQGESVVGAVYIPATEECVYAGTGQGAWYVLGESPPRPAKVSEHRWLADALFLADELATFDEIGRRDAHDRLQAAARLTRGWCDCYGYLMVATGRAELMVDPVVAAWDVAALLPVIEEAGGTFTDWQGRRTVHSGQSIATNGHIHQEVLAVIRGDEQGARSEG